MNALRMPLRVVFYKDDEDWVAHCLEFDLVGCAETQSEALNLLSEAINVQLAATADNGNLHNLFTPATGEYFEMFAAGRDVVEGELKISVDASDNPVVIEHTQVREFELEPSRTGEFVPASC